MQEESFTPFGAAARSATGLKGANDHLPKAVSGVKHPRAENCADIQSEIAQIRKEFGLPKNPEADARLAKANLHDFPPLNGTRKGET